MIGPERRRTDWQGLGDVGSGWYRDLDILRDKDDIWLMFAQLGRPSCQRAEGLAGYAKTIQSIAWPYSTEHVAS